MIEGAVHRFGDNIDTDQLAPGRYMKGAIAEIARHCLEAVDPGFVDRVCPGDIIVAGDNFGAGSSREQAVAALLALGVSAVVAKSFARIFFRNALNLGLPVLVCPTASEIPDGARIAVDPTSGRAVETATGQQHDCEPIPSHLMAMVRDGGLLPHLEKTLRTSTNG
ncbi:MAG: 3-isopropylmalate dehydratase small subunit [Xanthobacteraceae bacterium]|nr:3-isopropylmalate dehydratase small subunit [Xanthobacteraceae bacterium]